MKPFRLFLLICVSLNTCIANAKNRITLWDAINIHVHRTRAVSSQRLYYSNTLLEHDNIRKSYLPSLELSLMPLSFNRSMTLLQNYITGEHSNVEEYSNTSYAGITVSQKLKATGGILRLGSTLCYLREFSAGTDSYSTVPVFLSYSQSLFGGGRKSSLELRISELKKDAAMYSFWSSVSSEQQNILTMYLEAFSSKMDMDFYSRAVSIGDTLLMHARIRLAAGKITVYDYNLIELQLLEDSILLEKSRCSYEIGIRSLETELSIPDIEICDVEAGHLPSVIDEHEALALAVTNSPERRNLELERLSSELSLHNTRLSNRFNADISLSLGLNQYARKFRDAYARPDSKQSVSVSLSFPVFQWGIRRNRLTIANNEHSALLLEHERTIETFDESVQEMVSAYNRHRALAVLSEKRYKLSGVQYALAASRFNAGMTSALELSEAGKEHLRARMEYASSIQDLYKSYFKVRHSCLHDFVTGKDITDTI